MTTSRCAPDSAAKIFIMKPADCPEDITIRAKDFSSFMVNLATAMGYKKKDAQACLAECTYDEKTGRTIGGGGAFSAIFAVGGEKYCGIRNGGLFFRPE